MNCVRKSRRRNLRRPFKARLFLLMMVLTIIGYNCFSESVVLDVKNRVEEKIVFIPIHAGTVYFLTQRGFTCIDASEDYAVWLYDYHKEKIGEEYSISFSVKITPPTAWDEYDPLAEERVSFTYFVGKIDTMSIDESLLRFLRKSLSFAFDKNKEEAILGGMAAAAAIEALLATVGD